MSRAGGWEPPSRLHEHLQRAWRGERAPVLALVSHAYGACVDARNLLYEAGLLRSVDVPIPVLSVGGLTAGGSGKTPLSADIAAELSRRGHQVAILGPGVEDELEVHRHLCPSAIVLGGRDRRALARRAAADGAQVVVLDSGFQHRRLRRNLDLVAVDVETLVRARWRRLPAGPFRDRLDELHRADVIVTLRRRASTDAARAVALHLAAHFPRALHAACRLDAGAPAPFNQAAAEVELPRPAIATAAVMYPERFFAHIRHHLPSVSEFHGRPDHAGFPARLVEEWCAHAGARGIVCTLKDAVKLGRTLGERAPLWYVPEQVVWEAGCSAVRALLTRAAGGAAP